MKLQRAEPYADADLSVASRVRRRIVDRDSLETNTGLTDKDFAERCTSIAATLALADELGVATDGLAAPPG